MFKSAVSAKAVAVTEKHVTSLQTSFLDSSCFFQVSDLLFFYLKLQESLSCSGGFSVVRGPSEGRMRTEGGRSNPAPGYLGNVGRQREKAIFKNNSLMF